MADDLDKRFPEDTWVQFNFLPSINAKLALSRKDAAPEPPGIAEFQKILDHRGIIRCSPLGALTRLQLARAYAMQGDTAKAEAAYLRSTDGAQFFLYCEIMA